MVDKAFLKFDRDGNGCIDAADLKGVYNCSFHPKVVQGQMLKTKPSWNSCPTSVIRTETGKYRERNGMTTMRLCQHPLIMTTTL